MTNYFSGLFHKIIEAFWAEKLNRYLFIAALIFSVIILIIWNHFLATPEFFVYSGFSFYPIRYLAIILSINTFLSYFSYDKEKEISYLLLSANLFICFLIFCLEIFYLSHQ